MVIGTREGWCSGRSCHPSRLSSYWWCTHLWQWSWDRRSTAEAVEGRSSEKRRSLHHIKAMVSPYKFNKSRDYLIIHRNTEHSQADVIPACQLTLKNLQLDYIDLYLVSIKSTYLLEFIDEWATYGCVHDVMWLDQVCDLLQIHWPQALPRGVTFAEMKDEHYLGYSEERIADTWKVSSCRVV